MTLNICSLCFYLPHPGCQECATMPTLCSVGDNIQGFMKTRHTLYLLDIPTELHLQSWLLQYVIKMWEWRKDVPLDWEHDRLTLSLSWLKIERNKWKNKCNSFQLGMKIFKAFEKLRTAVVSERQKQQEAVLKRVSLRTRTLWLFSIFF